MPSMGDQLDGHNDGHKTKRELAEEKRQRDITNMETFKEAVKCLGNLGKDKSYYQGAVGLFIREHFEAPKRGKLLKNVGENELITSMYRAACENGKDDAFKISLLDDFVE